VSYQEGGVNPIARTALAVVVASLIMGTIKQTAEAFNVQLREDVTAAMLFEGEARKEALASIVFVPKEVGAILLGDVLAVIVGALILRRLGQDRAMQAAGIVGGLFSIFLVMRLLVLPYPLWYTVAAFAVYLIGLPILTKNRSS